MFHHILFDNLQVFWAGYSKVSWLGDLLYTHNNNSNYKKYIILKQVFLQ